jgi:DNA-binding NarL/FixJ family response regulator
LFEELNSGSCCPVNTHRAEQEFAAFTRCWRLPLPGKLLGEIMSAAIRIALIDRREMALHGLRVALGMFRDFEVVGLASTFEAALQIWKAAPDVALCGFLEYGEAGIQMLSTLCQIFPGSRLIVPTTNSETDQVRAALRTGSAGNLLKTHSISIIADSIRYAVCGLFPIDQTVFNHLGKDMPFARRIRVLPDSSKTTHQSKHPGVLAGF